MTLAATDPQIIALVGRLSLHYPQPALNEDANADRWADWCADLRHLPADIIAAACRDWRQSPAKYAPTPGQLLENCGGLRMRKILLQRAEDAIALLEAA